MTTFKSEIEQLYSDRSNVDAVASPFTAMFANSLNIVINTSLKGGPGFILELIQNAEDVGATEVLVRLEEDYLVLQHNGSPFSINDVREVCNFGHAEDTSKAENNQKIGYKGIGFKAVFSVSDDVTVVTEQGSFRFNKSHFKDKKNIPWQVCPIFTENEDLPKAVKQNQESQFQTTIALKLKPELSLSQEIQQLNDNPEILLFLNHIVQLRLVSKSLSSQLEVSKTGSVKDTQIVSLKRNKHQINQWIVMTSLINLDQRAMTILSDPNKDNTEYPDRLRSLKQTRIQFAARLDAEGHMIPGEGQFYAGLPTQVKTSALPVLVNGPNLLLDASRKQLQENEWNQYLLAKIPGLLIGWMQTLAQFPEHRLHVLSLLPMPILSVLPLSLQSSYKTALRSASQTKCIPMSQGETSINDAWLDNSGFSEVFPQFSTHEFVHRELSHKNRLTAFQKDNGGLSHVQDLDDIISRLESYFVKDQSLDYQQQLWRFIIARTASLTIVPSRLTYNCRILGVDGQFHALNSADKLYIPSTEMSVFSEVVKFPLVHPALYVNAPDIEKFLQKLGVQTVSPEHIIHQHLIPALEKNTHPEQNVAMLSYVFKHYSLLKHEDFQKLARAHVKNTRGEYYPLSQLYLSDIYDPEIKLEKSVPNAQCFIAADYLIARDIPWKKIFLELGAAENFKARKVTYSKEQVETALGGGQHARTFFDSKQQVDRSGVAMAYTIPMIELITDEKYSTPIWKSIEDHVRSGGVYSQTSQYIKYFLQQASVCLASDGKHYPSLSLLTDNVSDLVRSVVRHAKLPVKTYEYPLKDFLELRVKPTAAEWLLVLDALNTNKSRNVLHYQQVLEALYLLALREGKEAEIKSLTKNWQGELLAEDGTLQPVTKLRSCKTNHFSLRPTSHWLRQSPQYDTSKIADLFHIKSIGHFDYQVITKNSTRDEETIARLTDIRAISILAFVENMGKEYDHHQSVNEMRQVLSSLRPTVAHEVNILEKGDKSGRVLQNADFVYGFGNELTYAHSASNLFVAPEFARFLKQKLQLCNPYMDRILPMFISYDFDRFSQYLEQFCGYNLSDIPSVKLDEPQQKMLTQPILLQGVYLSVPMSRMSSSCAASPSAVPPKPSAGLTSVNHTIHENSSVEAKSEAGPSTSYTNSNVAAEKATGFRRVEEAERASMSAEEKAKLFQFVHGFKLGPKGVIFEGDMMSFEDITDKVRVFVLKEVNQYNRLGKSHEWGRGTVFQHLLQHYISKFKPDMKVAEMQSPTHIRFISKDHRKVIDVQWFKVDDKSSKKDFDGDIHVIKRSFNQDGKLTTEKVNKISVKASHAPKPDVATNVHLHWSKNKQEACLLEGSKSCFSVDEKATKQVQTSFVKVKF